MAWLVISTVLAFPTPDQPITGLEYVRASITVSVRTSDRALWMRRIWVPD